MAKKPKISDETREKLRKNGRLGGMIGGKRSLDTMTDDERWLRASRAGIASAKKLTAKQRRERARNAALARHSR